ncbi:MAG: N-acetylneuraminate lyase, partial [Clostridiales bacterium]|nr:N-acetylneuraminate lyase [Clostridiales bacterium]
KHTSSDFYMLNRIKARFPDKLVFNGYDEMFVSGMAMGADGGIGTTYNFMAEKFINMWTLCRQGQYEKARAVQSRANEIIEALLSVGVLPGTKEILRLMGLDVGVCRRPFRTLRDAEREMLRRAAAELL